MRRWKPRLTVGLASAACLAWLHWSMVAPGPILAWFDGAVFWSCVGALALLWGPQGARSAVRFGAAWYATSSHAERRRFFGGGLVLGLALGFFSGGGPLRVLGLVLIVVAGACLLWVTARRDLRRYRAGERLVALKWFLLGGFLLSYGYSTAYLALDDASRTDQVPGIRPAMLFFFGLVLLAVGHLVRRLARRLQ